MHSLNVSNYMRYESTSTLVSWPFQSTHWATADQGPLNVLLMDKQLHYELQVYTVPADSLTLQVVLHYGGS